MDQNTYNNVLAGLRTLIQKEKRDSSDVIDELLKKVCKCYEEKRFYEAIDIAAMTIELDLTNTKTKAHKGLLDATKKWLEEG